jgi:hypothetical protein
MKISQRYFSITAEKATGEYWTRQSCLGTPGPAYSFICYTQALSLGDRHMDSMCSPHKQPAILHRFLATAARRPFVQHQGDAKHLLSTWHKLPQAMS